MEFIETNGIKLNEQEIELLNFLSDGVTHKEGTQGMLKTTFEETSYTLKEKGLVKIDEYFPCIFDSTITSMGKRINSEVQNLLNKQIMLELLLSHGCDHDEAQVWIWLSDKEEHFDIPEGVDEDDFDEIIEEFENKEYIKAIETKDDGYKLSRKGKNKLLFMTDPKNKGNEDVDNILNSRIELLEKQLADAEATIDNQSRQIKELKRTVKEKTRAENSYDKKVTTKILLQLLANKSTYILGKMDRAKLISRLTGFSEEALKRLTDPDKIKLDPKVHKEQVIEANELLKSGNVSIVLKFD